MGPKLCPKCIQSFASVGKPCSLHSDTALGQMAAFGDYLNPTEQESPIKKADTDHKVLSAGKSRRNIFKLKVPEKRLQECGKGKAAGSIICQAESSLPNSYIESSSDVNTCGPGVEKNKSNSLLSKKRNNTSDDNHYEVNDVIKKADIDQKVLISGKSRRNLFKLKVPTKRLQECGKRNSHGSISCQAELPLPITYPESSIDVHNPGTSSKKCNSSPIPLRNRSNSSIGNQVKGNESLETLFPRQELHSSGISHASVSKAEVPVNQPLNCGKCGTSFSKIWKLRLHVDNNCDPKPYKCDLCDKKYTFEKNLMAHRVVHPGEKPYKCDMCGYSTNRRFYLNIHKFGHLRCMVGIYMWEHTR